MNGHTVLLCNVGHAKSEVWTTVDCITVAPLQNWHNKEEPELFVGFNWVFLDLKNYSFSQQSRTVLTEYFCKNVDVSKTNDLKETDHPQIETFYQHT